MGNFSQGIFFPTPLFGLTGIYRPIFLFMIWETQDRSGWFFFGWIVLQPLNLDPSFRITLRISFRIPDLNKMDLSDHPMSKCGGDFWITFRIFISRISKKGVDRIIPEDLDHILQNMGQIIIQLSPDLNSQNQGCSM